MRTYSKATQDITSYLGKLITIAQKEKNISNKELAERLNVTQWRLLSIQEGHESVSIGDVFECCFILKIPILGGDKEHIRNLSTMVNYMNNLLPKKIKKREVKDDF